MFLNFQYREGVFKAPLTLRTKLPLKLSRVPNAGGQRQKGRTAASHSHSKASLPPLEFYPPFCYDSPMSAANTFGRIFSVTSFGESRSGAVGVVIDGCPAGLALSADDFSAALEKRKAQFFFETPRREPDVPKIISGVFRGRTLGTPIAIIVENKNTGTEGYEQLEHVFRPGHADAAWQAKFGFRDFRGGGRSSGRETLARVLAGAVASKILAKSNITVAARPTAAAGLPCNEDGSFPDAVLQKIRSIQAEGNSCGGLVRCEVWGTPAGLGEPVFSKLDAELAKAVFSIGAVKGVEFGAGFQFAAMDGYTANTPDKNYNGGIIGGISTGETVYFTVAIKPIPSVSRMQIARTDTGAEVPLHIIGRHDTCLVRWICPVIEAMTALTLVDFLLRAQSDRI